MSKLCGVKCPLMIYRDLGARWCVLIVQLGKNLCLILCVFLVSACVSQTKVERLRVTPERKNEVLARQLFNQGKYQQAATLFKDLANKPSTRQDNYRLQVAQVLLKMGQYDKAKQYLDLVIAKTLSVDGRNQLQLLYAQQLLSTGSAEQAIKRLRLVSLAYLNRSQLRTYHEELAFAYALTGQSLASTRQRIALEPYLELDNKKENNNAILNGIGLLSVNELEIELVGQSDDAYSGWLELAIINAQLLKGTPEIKQATEAWSRRYPQHAGQELIIDGHFAATATVIGNISKIAVFLPESGAYHSYASAIKEGILAAYQQQGRYAAQADIQFYDTQAATIENLYAQAVSQGAQLIIGPLQKIRIQELVEKSQLTVPVLALNYVEGLVKENLYQFALSPIDDVQQAVNQAWFEGHENALILAPETADGERISGYFRDAWEAQGGRVLAVQGFDPKAKDFSFAVRKMLNINESQHRLTRVKRAIGDVEYNARRRQDVDVIFIVATNHIARLINPYFYHNRAESVAVYGLSRVYSGRSDPRKDIDLEGVSFCSIPWLFDQSYQGNLDMQALQELWQPLPDNLLSLIAFGIDAYRLPPYLNNLATQSFSGATGELLLNTHHRIERHLVCAKFKKGKVKLLETHRGGSSEPVKTTPKMIPTTGSF